MVQKSSINKPQILIIAGPTAVGKTKIALELYDKLYCELISADSMQVYRNCDIGTAKLSKDLLKKYPHHNIDIINIDEEYNTAIFKEYTSNLIQKITLENKLPIIVGGTGLYIESLLFPYNFAKCKKDEEYRKELECFYNENGKDKLYELLRNKDEKLAEQIDKNNIKKIIRALEILKHKEENPNENISRDNFEKESPYDYFILFVTKNREELYETINQRVDEMVNLGLVEEAKTIWEKQKNSENFIQVASAIGYKEFFEYFEGRASLEDCINKVKQHSRNYAKRQITWYNRYTKNIEKVNNDCQYDYDIIIKNILNKYDEFKKNL